MKKLKINNKLNSKKNENQTKRVFYFFKLNYIYFF